MMGISKIAPSKEYITFEVHAWYKRPFEHVCTGCFELIIQFQKAEDRTCDQCDQHGLPTLAYKLYPSMKALPIRYHNIPDVEAYVFPVTRMSDGKFIPVDNFETVMHFVAELSRYRNIVN
ncbi:hypothetical protein DAPPUDRAFT_257772 [Daphnia pulex]|uniref:Uncharacterized protein n=1 Tax=Daphnia pulex TaxID=6669 RepID=E9HE63_DAPPU|nr:hypothetical protein DAPPUDRAFT_257772 [Daphnia pulex]|eukprot:EFX69984.1 hypothetical protein DAPPUDRAFT_257772 [Daphnia pulex]